MNDRIEKIASQIRSADQAYFNTGQASLEDAAYDALKDDLRNLAPDHELLKIVGAKPSDMLTKARHSIPMGSLEKAMNLREFETWSGSLPPCELSASLKMDGGSISIEYQNGALFRAITRGDGFVGEDITGNARQFKDCPTKGVRIGGKAFSGFVRCEVMLTNEDWNKADPDCVSNPRNLGNGIARRKEGDQAELLTPFAFRAYFPDGTEIASTETEMIRELEKAGFHVAPWRSGSPADVWQFFEQTHEKRSALPYWIDGIVVKVENLRTQLSLGERDQRPKGQIAIKFPAEGSSTVLRSVSLSVGHTGAIIPTGKFDPVQLGGTTVANALLSNWDLIATLDIAVGDTVKIYKAGDIIPKVLEVLERPADREKIPEPKCCPVCGGPVGHKVSVHGDHSVMLYCLSEGCTAKQSGKIDRYIRSLNILGIGDEVIESLVRDSLVKTPADLYSLRDRSDRLESLAMGDKKVRLGAKRAKKILEEIESKRELTLAEFLGSLGIDGLGKRRVALIQQALPGQFDSLSDWLEDKLSDPATAESAGVPNLGPHLSKAVLSHRSLIESFLTNGVIIKADKPKPSVQGAKSFCFTGASSVPRAELKAMAEAKGHIVKDDVAKGLDYLVMADPDSTSSKAVKARKLGTQCISEANFRALVS